MDNLVSNALKYSPPTSTVRLQIFAEAGCVVVSVQDEGPGINQEDQKKLFQKFTRLSARPTGGESSTGLGLSIVKRLAEAMSGAVQCQSALGFGATFTLRLPAWRSETQDAAALAPAHPARARDSQTPVGNQGNSGDVSGTSANRENTQTRTDRQP